jgi:hypothetical protein
MNARASIRVAGQYAAEPVIEYHGDTLIRVRDRVVWGCNLSEEILYVLCGCLEDGGRHVKVCGQFQLKDTSKLDNRLSVQLPSAPKERMKYSISIASITSVSIGWPVAMLSMLLFCGGLLAVAELPFTTLDLAENESHPVECFTTVIARGTHPDSAE